MKLTLKLALASAVTVSLALFNSAAVYAQVLTATPTGDATIEQVAPSGRPTTIPRGQVTGISGPVVTVVHTEGKRRVYDPIVVNEHTKVWLGKRQATTKNLRLRQYLKIVGVKDGDVITASRIDILTSTAKAAPKPAAKVKTAAKPKVNAKPAPTKLK